MPESIFLIKLQTRGKNLLKNRILHRFFSVNFTKFLRTPILQKLASSVKQSSFGTFDINLVISGQMMSVWFFVNISLDDVSMVF